MSDGEPDLAEQLASALRPLLGPLVVDAPTRMSGGASRETWSFDAVTPDGERHELVLRRDPPGRPSGPGAMGREAAAMRAAAAEGVPVPEVVVVEEHPAPWGGAGVVMRRVGGEALPRRILRDDRYESARAVLVGQATSALAGIHRVRPEVVGDRIADPVVTMRTLLDAFDEPVPTFEVALQWLDERRPPASGASLVHGDFRLGNLMVDEAGLSSVLDWELVHPGDPAEDLGWLCVRAWRFGRSPSVAGLGTREELLEAYRAAGGVDIDAAVLRWWEVYGTLRWGAICLTQTAAHLQGALRSVELAAIGRRVAETEWDLLLLLAPGAAERAASSAADISEADPEPVPGLHGRPTVGELVEAVREQLAADAEHGGRGSYRSRVAANALRIVERELRSGAAQQQRRDAALRGVGLTDEAELTAAIRAGRMAADSDELLDLVASGVVDRVKVSNPGYLEN